MSLVTTVRTLAHEVMQRDQAARDGAERRYPLLLEMDSTDPKRIAELQETMRLLGKSPSDLAADLKVIQQFRELQAQVAATKGLDKKRQAAERENAAYAAETARIIEQRRATFNTMHAAAYALEQQYMNAQVAEQQQAKLKAAHGKLLVEEPTTLASIGE